MFHRCTVLFQHFNSKLVLARAFQHSLKEMQYIVFWLNCILAMKTGQAILQNAYTFPLLISLDLGFESIPCGSVSNAASGPGLDITWEVNGSVSEHCLWFSDRSGLTWSFVLLSIQLHPLYLSEVPRLLTCLTAAHILKPSLHMYRQMWTMANQRLSHPSLSLIGLDSDMG